LEKHLALEQTLAVVTMPIVWSCLTDAVGFMSLTASRVGPVRDFGIMMTIGSLMVLISVFLIVPPGALIGRLDEDPRHPWGQHRIDRQLINSVALVRKGSGLIFAGIVLFAFLAIVGMFQTEVETDFTKNFRSDSEIVQAYQTVENRLGGAGSCDLIIPAPETLDGQFLSRVSELSRAIDEELEARYGRRSGAVNRAMSLATAVETLGELDSQPAWLREGICQAALLATRRMMPEFFSALYGVDPADGKHYLRVMLRVPERQTAGEKRELIGRLKELGDHYFSDTKVTGYFVLLSTLIDSVTRDQWLTLAIAVAGIGLLMLLAFRDVRLAAIALVPNLLPVIGMVGLLGWLRVLLLPELKVNIGVAMIAAVSMGLSIDSSIHYITNFQRSRQSFGLADSMAAVQCQVGRSMVLSTLSLMVGFTVLATSQFVPTIYFGVLVSLTMLGGLLGNLVILPALLQFDSTRRDRSI
jgi:predicted RND superfamily exporter protein